jgi:hypothetical protein
MVILIVTHLPLGELAVRRYLIGTCGDSHCPHALADSEFISVQTARATAQTCVGIPLHVCHQSTGTAQAAILNSARVVGRRRFTRHAVSSVRFRMFLLYHAFIKQNTPLVKSGVFLVFSRCLGGKFDVFGDFIYQVVFEFVRLGTGSNRNLASDDNVFLQAVQTVSAARYGSVDQNAGRVLERCGR